MRLEGALDPRRFGGKAAALARARAAGLPVPDGITLAADAVEALARGDRTARAALAETETLALPVAVRSSAIEEDGAERSFAGQHETRLNVVSWPRVLDAIAAVAASAVSGGARAYRERHGLAAPARGELAVVVQEMAPARVAGVMFTRDPAGGEPVRVVESAWGLGEAVVAGLVVPDRYRLAVDGSVLAAEAGDKDVEIVPAPGGGTKAACVDGGRVRQPSLTSAELARLARLARGCEAVFGPGQDVEWAFAGGELLLLQSRPMTAGTRAVPSSGSA